MKPGLFSPFFIILISFLALTGVSFVNTDGVLGDEICDNAIDDDNDGLIDLNDPDCTCVLIEPVSLIPNPSFEERDCCPREAGQLRCATGWNQASAATTDFIHNCGWLGWDGESNEEAFPAPIPFPDGEGIIGFRDGFHLPDSALLDWKEYAGACLSSPMNANNRYRIAFNVGFIDPSASPPINVTIFGTTSCANLPFGGRDRNFGCPTNGPDWINLGSVRVQGGSGNRWIKTNIDIIPGQNIQAVAIGPSCAHTRAGRNIYYFLDNLLLDKAQAFDLVISTISHPCQANFLLAVPGVTGIQYQWYKDGIALIGENAPRLKQMHGKGIYRVRTGDDSFCNVSPEYDFTIPTIIDTVTQVLCDGELIQFGSQLLSEAGTYTATLKSRNNCDSMVTLTLIEAGSTMDTIWAKSFEGRGYMYGNQYFSTQGEHIIKLTSSKGCDSLVLLILEHHPVFLPSAFSPNNDGINERFTMIAVRGMIEKVEITIYSRWGRQLYRGPVWDGRYKGQLQLPGVYVYTARAQTFDGQEIQLKGTVTLLR